MNFDTINTTPCIPGTGSGSNGSGTVTTGPTDPRCSDATFAAANPDICGDSAYIVLKPSSTIIPVLGSVQFNVFLYQNGAETEVSTGLLFGSADTSIFVIGASSGNGTGLKAGQVVITATYQGLSATAQVTVVDSTIGCSQTPVATAIVIDNSKSSSLAFGGSYRTRLDFGKAVAKAYSGVISQVNGQPKDSVSIFDFNDAPVQLSTGFITDTTALAQQITSISQSQGNTDLSSAITAAATALQGTSAAVLVMLIISDGEQTDAPTEQDVINAASTFKQSGGIIFCIGLRASTGFELLERAATGGCFINALPSNASDALGGLSYLKSSVCAGACVPAGDYYAATAALDYSNFENWSVISGQCNLLGNGFLDLLPGNGLYVEMAENNHPATLQSKDKFALNPGDVYEIQFALGGNNETFTPSAGQALRVYVQDANSGTIIFDQTVSVNWNDPFKNFALSFAAPYAATVRLLFQQVITAGYTGALQGNLLDNIVFTDTTTLVTLLSDNFDEENVTYTPPACGPSAALPALVDPSVPGISFINYAGGAQVSSETYKYAFSYKTQQGETNLSPVASTSSLASVSYPNQAVLLSGISANPLVYQLDRILSIRIWRNDNSGSNTLYLLAELPVEAVNYVDLLNHTQFAAIVNASILPPSSNTTAVAQGALGFGLSGCYMPVCDPAVALGVQSADPSPLANIEAGGGSGGHLYNSTQKACGTCPAGGVFISETPITPASTSSASDGTVFQFSSPTTLNQISWILNTGVVLSASVGVSASPDGSNWVVLLPASNYTSAGGTAVGGSSTFAPSTYQYFKLVYDISHYVLASSTLNQPTVSANQTNCQSATASSYVSQTAADAAATAAAQQQLHQYLSANCVSSYSSTKSYTATCPCGTFGSPNSVTKTVTYNSFISQADADANALAQAKAQAQAALSCNQSNNSQQAVVPDGGQASVYPLVLNVTASQVITKLVCTIHGIHHQNFQDLVFLLVSPSGRTCLLMANCVGPSPIGYGNGSPAPVGSGVTFQFDDSGPAIPQNNCVVAGQNICGYAPPTSALVVKPTSYGAVANLGGCAPAAPWGSALSVFNGDQASGSWALYVVDSALNNYAGRIDSGFTLTIS